jgi:DNA polymerase-3 subunit epsilon
MVSTEEYNLRVSAFITNNSFENQNMVIVEKGRTVNERSAVLVENGVYKGYTFYDLNYQITNIEILKNILIPMQNNRDTRNIIQGHIRKQRVQNYKSLRNYLIYPMLMAELKYERFRQKAKK